MVFSILSKTHPPHLPIMEKNNMVTTKGRVKKNKKKLDISIFGSEPPKQPQIWIKAKKDMLFLGFLAHLGPKKIFKFFSNFFFKFNRFI